MRGLQGSISIQAGFSRRVLFCASLAGGILMLFVMLHAQREKATGVHGVCGFAG